MRHTLICTLGTSLFYPNLKNLPTKDTYNTWLDRQPEGDRAVFSLDLVTTLKTAFDQKDWNTLALQLTDLPANTRLCGAEINSITDLLHRGYCTTNARIVLCHSETDEGNAIAEVLRHYYELAGHPVECKQIEGLQDKTPKTFRTKGLRNLVKAMSQVVLDRGAQYCAINATGGYKAQIAIGVLLGQALQMPVYYKHERFSEIIAFPPMPVSLDFNLWLANSGWLMALDQTDKIPAAALDTDWEEALESLIEREQDQGIEYVRLSPTGQIFHTAFKDRYRSELDQLLPPAVLPKQKRSPKITDHSWGNGLKPIQRYLQRITDDCPYVMQCITEYWNPDLSRKDHFRLKGEQIEGIFSNGTWTVKFIVETTSTTPGQRNACIYDLNRRFVE